VRLFSIPVMLFAVCLSSLGAEPDVRILEVTARLADHGEPWKVKTERIAVPAVFFGERYAAAFVGTGLPGSGYLRSRDGYSRETVELVDIDSELHIAVYRLPEAKPSSDKRNPSVPRKFDSNDLPPLKFTLTDVPAKTALRAVGGQEPYTVFYEGVDAVQSPAGNAPIPAIRFSAFQANVQKGQFLTLADRIIGIILSYDRRAGKGYALPASLFDQYLAGVDMDSPALVLEPMGGNSSRQARTIVRSSGFSGRVAVERPFLQYSGSVADRAAYLVEHTLFMRTEERELLSGDLVLSAGSRAIGSRGTLPNDEMGELPIELAICLEGGRFTSDDQVPLEIIRNAEKRRIRLPIRSAGQLTATVPARFLRPAYLIEGGLVFLELSQAYPGLEKEERLSFVHDRYREGDNTADERLVILDRILPIAENQGYRPSKGVLTSVNGIGIRSLKHAHSIVREARRKGEDVVFTLDGNVVLAFSSRSLAQSDDQVRKTYGIPFLSANSLE
jgi:hypothetical protein